MKKSRPSDLEMQILSVLWDNGPSTAREVLGKMPDGKKRAYTSILSVMQVMEKKGFLSHSNRGVAHVYRPVGSRNKIIKPYMRKVVNEIFAGRKADMIQALMSEASVSDEELAEIRAVLDNARSSDRGTGKKGKS